MKKGDLIDSRCWLHESPSAGSCVCVGRRGPWRIVRIREDDGFIDAELASDPTRTLGAWTNMSRQAVE